MIAYAPRVATSDNTSAVTAYSGHSHLTLGIDAADSEKRGLPPEPEAALEDGLHVTRQRRGREEEYCQEHDRVDPGH